MADPTVQQYALPAQTRLAEYRLESVLGAGGFGVTYLARDTHLEKDVAIKEYLPADLGLRALDGSVVPVNTDTAYNYRSGLEQFLVEARTLARFSHPNIVRVSRYFEANGTAYMVMDYEKGHSFNQFLKKVPQPEEAHLKAMITPLLDGLEAVHAAGFLHRDIKPSNIFIRTDGTSVLLDFGSARLAVRDAVRDVIAILTPGYAPVELYLSTGQPGPWTDIYSLAAVLYRAVTGDNPPEAPSRLRIDGAGKKLAAVRERYSPQFLAAIQWGLALEEKRRPQNVNQWRGALLRSQQARAATATPETAAAGAEAEPDRTRKYVWMALGIVTFFLFMEGADIVKQRAEQQRAPRAKPLLQPGQPARPVAAPAAGGLEARVAGAQNGLGAGLTREELAQNLPHLADKFSEIDADRDGRVTVVELQAYWQRNSRGAPGGAPSK
ncbi:MAG: serine/threonine protein kinase [Betaproteobacteria bacterium]|nr:serine/threonine protein kinase [Betaproteobacteria bacterium]